MRTVLCQAPQRNRTASIDIKPDTFHKASKEDQIGQRGGVKDNVAVSSRAFQTPNPLPIHYGRPARESRVMCTIDTITLRGFYEYQGQSVETRVQEYLMRNFTLRITWTDESSREPNVEIPSINQGDTLLFFVDDSERVVFDTRGCLSTYILDSLGIELDSGTALDVWANKSDVIMARTGRVIASGRVNTIDATCEDDDAGWFALETPRPG